MESLDVSAPLFGVAEVAEVSGISRPNIDLLVSQKLVRPTRRIKAARPASAKSRGKPMFSVRAIYIVRLIRELHSLGLSYADSAAIADQTEKAKLSKSDAKNLNKSLANIFEVADGDWIRACAESPSVLQKNRVYAYASRIGEKWSVEVHLATTVHQSFSKAPQVLIPASDIFFAVYAACNNLLGNAGKS